jgi:hypothetical protein
MASTMRGSVLFAVVSVACSSSGPAPVQSQLQFSVTTSSQGGETFPCDSAASGITTVVNGSLSVFCDRSLGPSSAETVAEVTLQNFHGPDTYTFQGSNDAFASSVQFTMNGWMWSSVPASAGISATSCSVTVTSPASPQRGDAVSGTLHCDAMLGLAVGGDGGYQGQRTTSVDGTFSGFDTL